MPTAYFNWERFWVPRGTELKLIEDAYLPDPSDEWNKSLNPQVVPSAYFQERPCVVLLGDAAMGKSTAVMEVERAAIDSRIHTSGGEPWREPLNRFSSESLLVADVFRSLRLQGLEQLDRPLHLYLDDFDECLLRIPTLPRLLIHELRNYNTEVLQRNLRLRILCRTSVWPDALTERLKEIWGDSGVDVYELAPLRLKDIQQAAAESSFDPVAFVSQVRQYGVSGFASRPLTLKTLLKRFGRGEDFPTSQSALFSDACLDLCEAYDRGEFGPDRPARLAPADRLAVASRIAAAAMFSGREFIDRRWDASDDSAGAVSLRELIGKEILGGREIPVGEYELDEVLQTGLFTGTGTEPETRRWAHRTYAEFLAADYVAKRNLTLEQVRSLLVHPSDPDGRLVPPLHETAAWLAAKRDDVGEDILLRDPSVLLSTDVIGIAAQFRPRLVDALLSRYDAGELIEPDWATRNRFRNLDHPDLGQQLRPWIRQTARRRIARGVAIDIAEQCKVSSVLNDLVQVALDPTDDLRVRIDAAAAVSDYGDASAKGALKPLLAGAAIDPELELKGYALQATWPQHLSATELFETLTLSRPNFFGAYRQFLYRNPVKDLERDDLVVALAWVDRHLGPGELPHDIEDLVENIMRKSISALDDPEVAGLFGPLAWRYLHSQHRLLDWSSTGISHENGLPGELNDECRLDIVKVLVESATDNQELVRDLAYIKLVVSDDVPWLLNQLSEADNESLHREWARAINSVLHPADEDHLASIRALGPSDPILYAETERWQDPEALARRVAEAEAFWREQEQRQAEKNPLLVPSPLERVTRHLEDFAAGDLSAWWQLNLDLTLEPTSRYYGNEHEPDLTSLPGWQEADESVRGRIVEAAMSYVRAHQVAPDKWLATNIIFRPDWAGYRALHLLWKVAPTRLNELEPADWRRWVPVVVGYHTLMGTGDQIPQQALVRMAYQIAPDEVLEILVRLIRAAGGSTPFEAEHELQKVAECWDDRLATTLRDLLTDPSLPWKVAGVILAALLEHHDEQTEEVAASWVAGPQPSGPVRERAIDAAVALILGAGESGWDHVWPSIQADADFGEQIFTRLVWRDRFAEVLVGRLSIPQLVSLYLLLEDRYPESGDPNEPGMHEVTFREEIGHWRDGVLVQIARYGTAEAVEALRKLTVIFPSHEGIRRLLVRTAEAARTATWRPPTPIEVLELARTDKLRLIQNADQLLDAVLESLQRLQIRLQDEESRAVVDLWSVVGQSTFRGVAKQVLANLRGQLVKGQSELRPYFRIEEYWKVFGSNAGTITIPKNELLLSDYIKRHLDIDLARSGIIINREVQNRKGDITDIRVQAFAKDEHGNHVDPVTVVVEVKGRWHRDLETAMVDQLAERYLQPQNLRHGVYLVGWFNTELWDSNDRRRQRAAKYDLDQLIPQLHAQASGLMQQGLVVKLIILDVTLPSDAKPEPPADLEEESD